MKKLLRMIALTFIGGALITGTAAAQTSIENTGPRSNNTINIKTEQDCKIKNNNNVNVKNNTQQSSTSGNAVNNSKGGIASTGNASNNSSTSTNISIKNQNECNKKVAKKSNQGNVTKPEQPGRGAESQSQQPKPQMQKVAAGGRGAGEVQGVSVAALPETNAGSPATYAAVAAGALVGVAIVSRLGLAAVTAFGRK